MACPRAQPHRAGLMVTPAPSCDPFVAEIQPRTLLLCFDILAARQELAQGAAVPAVGMGRPGHGVRQGCQKVVWRYVEVPGPALCSFEDQSSAVEIFIFSSVLSPDFQRGGEAALICTKNVPVSRSFQGICDSSSLAPSQSSGSRAPAVFMNRLHEHNGLCRFCSSFPDVTLFLSRGRVVHPSSGASHTPTFQAPVSPRCPSRCFISPPRPGLDTSTGRASDQESPKPQQNQGGGCPRGAERLFGGCQPLVCGRGTKILGTVGQ